MKNVIRKLAAPALLAAVLAPVALTAQAGPHSDEDRAQMREHRQEQRQEVYQRAGIDEEKQQALDEVNTEFFEAMKSLRDDHHARIAEILTDEEQQAVRDAMNEVRGEHREHKRAERGQQESYTEGETLTQ